MRALDGPILEMPCAGPDNLEACARPQDCSVHEVFERVHDSLAGALARHQPGRGGAWPPAARPIRWPCAAAWRQRTRVSGGLIGRDARTEQERSQQTA